MQSQHTSRVSVSVVIRFIVTHFVLPLTLSGHFVVAHTLKLGNNDVTYLFQKPSTNQPQPKIKV